MDKLSQKFADFPLVVLSIYGRERHPEFSPSEAYIIETYAKRVERARLMMLTLNLTSQGFPANRHLLIDESFPVGQIPEVGREQPTMATVATALYGLRPQGGWIIDPTGHIVSSQIWERPEKEDEVLSQIFGVEAGL